MHVTGQTATDSNNRNGFTPVPLEFVNTRLLIQSQQYQLLWRKLFYALQEVFHNTPPAASFSMRSTASSDNCSSLLKKSSSSGCGAADVACPSVSFPRWTSPARYSASAPVDG